MRTPIEVENTWLDATTDPPTDGVANGPRAAAIASARLRLAPATAAEAAPQHDYSGPAVTIPNDNNHAA